MMNRFVAFLTIMDTTSFASLASHASIAAEAKPDPVAKENCIKACKKWHDTCEAMGHKG